MKKWQHILGNAIIGAAIVFMSSLSISFPPTMENVWVALIGGLLFLLAGLQLIFKEAESNDKDSGQDKKKGGKLLLLGVIF